MSARKHSATRTQHLFFTIKLWFHKDFYHHFKKAGLQCCPLFNYQLNYVNIQQDKRICVWNLSSTRKFLYHVLSGQITLTLVNYFLNSSGNCFWRSQVILHVLKFLPPTPKYTDLKKPKQIKSVKRNSPSSLQLKIMQQHSSAWLKSFKE